MARVPQSRGSSESQPPAAAVDGLEGHEINAVIIGFKEDQDLDGFGLASAPAGVTPIGMPSYVDGMWEWGLGLDAEGRKQVVSEQGDVLWKSV